MEITLDRLGLGQSAIVTCVGEDTALASRLRDYGMIPGTTVCCRYRTPDGSVTSLDCRGGVIALRTRDMKSIRGQRL